MSTQDNTLRNLQRKLDRWELPHLRALALELHERLERTEEMLERVLAERDSACFSEQALQDYVWQLQEALDDAGIAAPTLGIRQGELLASPAEH